MASPTRRRPRPSNWNLPNIITVVRILLAPLFFWMLLADNGADGALRWWAAVLFIVAIATDGIDGAIARRHNLVTDLGKLLDPIADKVLTGGALVGLSILGELPWWVTDRHPGARGRHHRVPLRRARATGSSRPRAAASSRPSCSRSRSRSPCCRSGLVFGDWVHWVNGVAMTVAVVLTVVTGIDYLVAAAAEASQHSGGAADRVPT